MLLIVLILGAGTDYGLFLVFRVREELYRGHEPGEAVAIAVFRVGESISASAGTVIVALLSLLFASFGIYHDLGPPLAVGIAVMLLAGLTLLPALLAIFGRAVFWPSKAVGRERREGLWGRVAGRLVRKPALTLVVGVVIFGGLAVAVTGGPAAALPSVSPPGSSIPASTYNAYRATARFISTDGRIVQWEAGPKAGDPSSTSALNAVPTIRTQVAHVANEAGATANGVAGEAPGLYDVSTVSDGDILRIVPIAVLAIGIVLALVLRSLIAPLYLIASVVLSYLASLGIAVIAFIYVGGEGGITFLLPFLMFIFLLALGEDYNILVMTRIREEAAHRPLREAVVRAVGATGPTVTSAGLVLAGTFAVLAAAGGSGSGGSQVRAIGVGLAVGILLDTFVVRTVLDGGLLGRWNWWPSAMGRRHHDEPSDAPPPPPAARTAVTTARR